MSANIQFAAILVGFSLISLLFLVLAWTA